MTREEALNKAIGVLTYHQVNFCKSKEAVANMNEIIEALEKIDQEPCGDCISRQAVLEVIRKCHCEEWVKADIGAPIEALQSVTPQPKIGRWTHDGSHWKNRWICSECGYKLFYKQTRFCPNCGAKMWEIPTGQIVANGELYPGEFDDPFAEEGSDKE